MKIEIISKAAVMEFITGLKTRAVTLQAEIHQAAVSTLDHCREHGDYRGALALVNALPSGQRVEGLMTWFAHFSNGKLTFKKDNASGARVAKLSVDRVDSDFDIEAAMLTDFGSLTKEAKPAVFTVEKLLKFIESKANNTETNADGTPKVADDARAVAAKLVASYRSQMAAAISAVTVQ